MKPIFLTVLLGDPCVLLLTVSFLNYSLLALATYSSPFYMQNNVDMKILFKYDYLCVNLPFFKGACFFVFHRLQSKKTKVRTCRHV
jgi:hypothetical protein